MSQPFTLSAANVSAPNFIAWLTDFGMGGQLQLTIESGSLPAPSNKASLTASATFLNVTYTNDLQVTLTADANGNFCAVTIIGPCAAGFFSQSFPTIPAFLGLPGGYGSNAVWLDALVGTGAVFIFSSVKGVEPTSGASYGPGLNFAVNLATPPGVQNTGDGYTLGLFPVTLDADDTLLISGSIVPETASAAILPALAAGAFPWQPTQLTPPPGIFLSAALGGAPTATGWGIPLSATTLHIYSPLTTTWLTNNPSYVPAYAVGTQITAKAFSGELVVEQPAGGALMLALSCSAGGLTLGQLVDVVGSDLTGSVPQPLAGVIDSISLQALAVTFDSNFALASLSITVGLDDADTVSFGELQLNSASLTFVLQAPLSSPVIGVVAEAVIDISSAFQCVIELSGDTEDDFSAYGSIAAMASAPTLGTALPALSDLPAALADLTLSAAEYSYTASGGATGWSLAIMLGDETSSLSQQVGNSAWTIENLTFATTTSSGSTTWQAGGQFESPAGNLYSITAGSTLLSVVATFPGAGLTLPDLLTDFGLTPPTELSYFSIALTEVGFYQDSSATGGWVFVIDTLLGGETATDLLLINTTIDQSEWTGGILAITPDFSFTSIPLLGALASDLDLSISLIQVFYSSVPLPSSQVSQAQALLSASGLGGEGLVFPAGGLAQVLTVALTLNLEGDSVVLTIPISEQQQEGGLEFSEGLSAGLQGATVWTQINQQVGPLTISQVGLGCSGGSLSLEVDASLAVGPVNASIVGLGISFDLSGSASPQFLIEGIDVSYQANGVSLSGSFLNVDPPPQGVTVEYAGDLMAKTQSFGFSAVGSYAVLDGGTPSLLAIASIQHDFGGPPYFFVDGLCGGFGENRALTLPPIGGVASFPLIAAAQGGTAIDSIAALTAFTQGLETSMAPQTGTDWLAAGVTFTSMNLIDGVLLLSMSWGVQTQFGLLGSATLTLPPDDDDDPTAEVELMIEGSYTPADSELMVLGQLSPQSYVLSPQCLLTGGFAVGAWFDGSPYAGDFVATIGGYNPNFTVPANYPSVERLSLKWSMSGAPLTIQGGLYFALVPHCVMLGTEMQAVWSSGSISAWFAVSTDFLATWSPFTYQADLGVTFGVTLVLDLAVTTKTLTLSVGADLDIQGPPFGGTAAIDVSVMSFTISFGPAPVPATPLTWSQFQSTFLPPASPTAQALRVPGTEAVQRLTAGIGDGSGQPPVITFTITDGLLDTVTLETGVVGAIIDPGRLSLSLSLVIPASQIDLITPQGTSTVATGADLAVGPMGLQSLASTVSIILIPSVSTGTELTLGATGSLGSVPKGLWATVPSLDLALNQPSLVDGALIGAVLIPDGEVTGTIAGPYEVTNLVYAADQPNPVLVVGGLKPPHDDPWRTDQPLPTLLATVAAEKPSAMRAGILSTLAAQQFALPATLDVAPLASRKTVGLPNIFRLRRLAETTSNLAA